MSKKKSEHKIDILLMADNGLETVGGEQESTKIIINGLKDKFTLGVIQPGKVKLPSVGVTYFDLTHETRIKHIVKKPLSFIRYIEKVRRIIKIADPDVIHTQAQVSFFIVALLKKIRLISNQVKLIHTERGLYTKYSSSIKKIFQFFMKDLNVLVTTTQFNMEYWKESIKSKGITLDYKIIENTAGAIFETYDESLEKKDEKSIVVGFAGRYTDWKNWPLAVEICEKLNEHIGDNLEIRMAVGCLDDISKVETKVMFEYLAKKLGSRFKGQINISLQEMDNFYYEIDFFILTSNDNTESFGRTLVEAMSRRTAVLTTNAGGPLEVVGNEDRVCNSSEEFLKKILAFKENMYLLDQEKELNLVRVKKKYSLRNNIDKHLALYNIYIKGSINF